MIKLLLSYANFLVSFCHFLWDFLAWAFGGILVGIPGRFLGVVFGSWKEGCVRF
jgi:hypothetical protein